LNENRGKNYFNLHYFAFTLHEFVTAEAQVSVKVTGEWRHYRGNRGALTDLLCVITLMKQRF